MPVAALLALLPTLITGVEDLYALVQKITTDLKQNAELTTAQQAELDAHIADLESKDWWKVQD